MDRETQFAAELQALRALCDEAIPRDERQRSHAISLLNTLSSSPSIRSSLNRSAPYFSRGPISEAQLRVHLNNRGFPDTDVEKYFQPAPAGNYRTTAVGQNNSMTEKAPSETQFQQAAGDLFPERRGARRRSSLFWRHDSPVRPRIPHAARHFRALRNSLSARAPCRRTP